MNHLTYQLALSHQDDLLRAAANERLASQLSGAGSAPRARARRALRKPRLARLHRLVTRPARTSMVEPQTSVVDRYAVLSR